MIYKPSSFNCSPPLSPKLPHSLSSLSYFHAAPPSPIPMQPMPLPLSLLNCHHLLSSLNQPHFSSLSSSHATTAFLSFYHTLFTSIKENSSLIFTRLDIQPFHTTPHIANTLPFISTCTLCPSPSTPTAPCSTRPAHLPPHLHRHKQPPLSHIIYRAHLPLMHSLHLISILLHPLLHTAFVIHYKLQPSIHHHHVTAFSFPLHHLHCTSSALLPSPQQPLSSPCWY